MWDHEVSLSGGLAAIFECKAVDETAAGTWRNPVPLVQLDAYCALPWPVLYVLLGQPRTPNLPWIRSCKEYGCASSPHCLACPSAGPGTRKWAGSLAHVATATAPQRLQPWFCHWAWVVTARDLRSHLAAQGISSATQADHSLPAMDRDLRAIVGSERLCHWLLQAATPGLLPSGLVPTSENARQRADVRYDLDLSGEGLAQTLATAQAVARSAPTSDATPPILVLMDDGST
jgi:hypothetical protein